MENSSYCVNFAGPQGPLAYANIEFGHIFDALTLFGYAVSSLPTIVVLLIYEKWGEARLFINLVPRSSVRFKRPGSLAR